MGRPRKYPPLEGASTPKDLLALAQGLPIRIGARSPGGKAAGAQESRFAMIKVWRLTDGRRKSTPSGAGMASDRMAKDTEKPTKLLAGATRARVPRLRQYVKIARARWRIELDYRELKDELGLDHFEGAIGGLNHHVTLVSVAYAFLRAEQARRKKNFWCDLTSDTSEPSGSAD